MSQAIPIPPSIPFIGHAASIEKELPLHSFVLLSKQYGEIFQLNMLGTKVVHISSHKLLDEVSDEKRFRKTMSTMAWEVRNATADGLFTADVPKEKNWFIAHRILMPAFSTTNVRNMFDGMLDVTLQLTTKWERFGPKHKLDPSQDFTALTLEAITLCSMSYRMNSFYIDGLHPFAKAMSDFLAESGNRSMRPTIVQNMMRGTNAKYEADKATMMKYVDDILQERKAHPSDKNDILHLMMTGKDKETGLGMTDESIRLNMVTFLIAGHETTSGLLSFVLYHLLKNPEAMRKLREEVDTKIGQRAMTVDDVHKLPYLIAVLRETLRLSPPASMRAATPLEDTTLDGGKYAVEKDSTKILCNIYQIHRDPAVWGADAEEFKPERMLDGKFEALPPNAWQPFGYGMRGCIGRPFAWQEAQMVIVHIMQRFDLIMDDPTYDLKIKQTLTIKPKDFYIYALPRKDKPNVVATSSSTLLKDRSNEISRPLPTDSGKSKQSLYVLYGSNTGNSEAFAQRIATEAGAHGFGASIGALDSAVDHPPKDGPVIIVTASFEGQPADNAAHFVEWISALNSAELDGVSYAVFGCGNKDWVATYQRIPKLIDDVLCKRGGKRLVPRGEGDAGSGEFFESFDTWIDGLWKALAENYGVILASESASAGIEIKTLDIGTTRATVLRQPDAALGTCVGNRVLTAPGTPEKRHLEFDLPEDASYRAGDYLAILPVNPPRDVSRALARFNLSGEQEITITSSGPSPLPTNRPISVSNLLSGYVELSQPATTRDLRILADLTEAGSSTRTALKALAEADTYTTKVLAARLSVLDILEAHKDINIPFSAFLGILPSMRVRQYSISSSPLANPLRATLTVSVLSAPRADGNHEPFLGVASTYLASLRPGDKVQLVIRPSAVAFHPPSDLTIPLIMLCAGSGLAPMRGFLEERAIQKQSGRDVAKCLLFFGCRSPEQDYLYGEKELKLWEEAGVVDVRPAFSRDVDKSEGCKYIQDRLWKDKGLVIDAWEKGSKIYVCGSGKVANAVKETLLKIIQDYRNVDLATATDTFNKFVQGRFATDVFE